MDGPTIKRRRISLELAGASESESLSHGEKDRKASGSRDAVAWGNGDSISIASHSKLASKAVAPFLANHIPFSHDSTILHTSIMMPSQDLSRNSDKLCYKHRLDLKCRRQADEPSMGQLQRELETLSENDRQGVSHVWALFSAAPAKHRELMLQGLLTQCCFPQLSYLSARVKELIRIDFLLALPAELAFKVLCYLDTTSLCKAAQVSQRWRLLADDDVVWHRMCEQHIDRKCSKCGWGLPLLEQKKLRATKRQMQLRAASRGEDSSLPNLTPAAEVIPNMLDSIEQERSEHSVVQPLTTSSSFPPRARPWKDVYRDRFQMACNWKHGRFSMKILRGHENGVMCLQFDDNILASGSYDSTIRIWDLETGTCLRILYGHVSGIRCLQFDETKLISGSLDHTIKVWNWRTGECTRTIRGHGSGVIGLHFVGARLAAGGIDHTVRVWNFEDRSNFVLRGHTDWVNTVKIDHASNTLFSGSDDGTVRLWDLNTQSTMRTFKGHVGQIQQIVLLPPEFEIDENLDSSNNGADTHLDGSDSSRASSPITDVIGLQEQALPRYMLTAALDATVMLWDVHTGQRLRTFFGHVEGCWALAADTLRIVSGAQDRVVKIWNAHTGNCERTITGHAGPVTCLGLSDSSMCTGSEDGEIRAYSFS